MSAPNLNSSSLTVNGATDVYRVASTSEQTLTAAVATGHTYITLSLTVENHTASSAPVRLNWYDGTNNNYIVYDATVPANAQMECCPTRKVLPEGWSVKVTTTGNASGLTWTHHYLDCH